MNPLFSTGRALAIAIALALPAAAFAEERRPPQFVVFSFDGSLALDRWEDTLRFARELRARQAPGFGFTYFISGVYFLAPENKTIYHGPRHRPGQSDIGFSGSRADILERIDYVNQADAEGNEIASHANGHFQATEEGWTEEDWGSELRQFNLLTFDEVFRNNGFTAAEAAEHAWLPGIKPGVIGFRAPYLAVTPGLWPALRKFGFKYDASRTAPADYWPEKLDGVWNFPLAELRIAGTGKKTLSMDYNFYDAQSSARPVSDPVKCKQFEDQTYETYLDYFQGNYSDNRAPLHIGHHFSLWNQGAYWNALKRFASEVCGRPEVRCVTYRELQESLEAFGEERIAEFQRGNFPRLDLDNPRIAASPEGGDRAAAPPPSPAAPPRARGRVRRPACCLGASALRSVPRRRCGWTKADAAGVTGWRTGTRAGTLPACSRSRRGSAQARSTPGAACWG
ncbi:hypothetical protein [Sorangium cellulosum]|uniref:hypothetical protein n=1 Tax=Sorangium cellulosum TaxID=56 RepID=UPI00067709B3|nr:hypothetical protein [Sorangium cellulosum]